MCPVLARLLVKISGQYNTNRLKFVHEGPIYSFLILRLCGRNNKETVTLRSDIFADSSFREEKNSRNLKNKVSRMANV